VRLRQGLCAAAVLAVVAAPAVSAHHRPGHGHGNPNAMTPVTYAAPYSSFIGYGGCSDGTLPTTTCEWTGTATKDGLVTTSSRWVPGTSLDTTAANAYGGAYMTSGYTMPSGVRSLKMTATYEVVEDLTASAVGNAGSGVSSWVTLYGAGCRASACALDDRSEIVDSYIGTDTPSSVASGTTITHTATLVPSSGTTFEKGSALVRTVLVSFAAGAQVYGTESQAGGVARLVSLTVTPQA
jgi:hypothetical protein